MAHPVGTQKFSNKYQLCHHSTGSRDLGLLITLLACRHGIAEGLRFISIFDKDYQNLWKPVDMRVNQDPDRYDVLSVEQQLPL